MVHAGVLDHVEDRPRAYVCIRELASLEPPARAEVQVQRDAYWRRARAVLRAGVEAGDFAAPSTALATFCLTELISSPAAWWSEDRGSRREEVADQIAAMALQMVGY